MPTILAASDLTERSQHVLSRAVALAENLDTEVLFVHAAPRGVPDMRCEAARAQMQEQCDTLRGGERVRVQVLRDRAELAIPQAATDEDAMLVVLGVHRPRPVLDLLRLTTMERIVLRSASPVLLAQLPPERSYQTVLSALDFSAADAAALAFAARIAPDASFHAIHALHLPLREKLSGARSESGAPSLHEAQERCEAWLTTPGVPAKLSPPEIIPGSPHEVLGYRIDELQPDLLTIGASASSHPDRLGNIARDLMREPPTDVLVAKAPE